MPGSDHGKGRGGITNIHPKSEYEAHQMQGSQISISAHMAPKAVCTPDHAPSVITEPWLHGRRIFELEAVLCSATYCVCDISCDIFKANASVFVSSLGRSVLKG
eukprot:1943948-Karenia_brevis.AAC.2